jgi:hypothetical protein
MAVGTYRVAAAGAGDREASRMIARISPARLLRFQWVCLNWTAARLRRQFRAASKPVHILFCTADHYEPGTRNATVQQEKARVDLLLERYPALAAAHKDAAGNVPKRTWFFPPHYHRHDSLKKLVSLCEQGFGEVELHLHHGKRKPDTAENLKRTLELSVREYSRLGIFGSEAGQKRYAFVHGDWALDNSRGGKFCGVDNELAILRETGCYADFTFPSLTEADPLKINAIYSARGVPGRAKNHNTGDLIRRAGRVSDDLMIIQGPVHPYAMDRQTVRNTWFRLRALGDSINSKCRTTPRRIDAWVRTGIHVCGKPDWLIVKTSTHGAADPDAALGPQMDEIFTYLETKYNDGENFLLHYVTARELYNMIKAIEAGEPCDDPEDWRDYRIQPPAYCSQAPYGEASDELMQLVYSSY